MIRHYNLSKIGTSHVEKGTICQDANKVIHLENGWVIAAIADGVGSASRSEIGANIAVETSTNFLKEKCESFNIWNEKFLESLLILSYCIALKEIKKRADDDYSSIEAYSTTLSVAIYDGTRVAYGHSGDGGIITLNNYGTFNQLTAVQKGDEDNQVISLRFGIDFWDFGFSDDDPVCSVLLATDGLYDVICPRIKELSNPIHISAARPFMDRNPSLAISLIKGLDTDDGFNDLNKYLNENIDAIFPDVTDDKTIVVLVNTDIIPSENSDPTYYDEPDFEKLNEEQESSLYKVLNAK